jgi:hypothetical protein
MNAADEMAAQPETTEHQSASIAPGSDGKFDKFDKRLRATVKDFQRTSDQWKPAEDLQNLLSRIDHNLDYETSERRAIYYRLVALEGEMKRRGSRKFARYLVAICIGIVAGALTWQVYGEASKQIIATSAAELGWSPEAKQMITGWIQQLGWRKPPAGYENTAIRSSVRETPQAALVAQTAPEGVAPKMSTTASVELQRVQQMEMDIAAARQTVEQQLAAVRETVEQLAARQDQMEGEITKLQAVDMEILAQIPSPPAQPPAIPARKPMTIAPPSSRQP